MKFFEASAQKHLNKISLWYFITVFLVGLEVSQRVARLGVNSLEDLGGSQRADTKNESKARVSLRQGSYQPHGYQAWRFGA